MFRRIKDFLAGGIALVVLATGAFAGAVRRTKTSHLPDHQLT
jgi:hypothetical protein